MIRTREKLVAGKGRGWGGDGGGVGGGVMYATGESGTSSKQPCCGYFVNVVNDDTYTNS